jgi:site-specific DNA-methyltransferase (adenine-specific)
MVKKLEERAITAELARRQQDRVEATSGTAKGLDKAIVDTVKMAGGNYIIGSCFDGLAKLKTNSSINIIECDPPYGIDLQDQKGDDALVGNSVGYKEVSRDHYPEFLATLTKELYRVAGKDCWLIFWFGPTWQAEVLKSLREAGWLVDEIPAIWTKPQGQTLQPELYYARCYEPFYLARKGKPVMAERGHSNVFSFNGSKDKYHPTQRPVDLIEEIFNTLHVGTGTVLVPFLGSGATLRACYNLGLSGFGWDLDGKYKDKFLLAVEEDVRRLFKE